LYLRRSSHHGRRKATGIGLITAALFGTNALQAQPAPGKPVPDVLLLTDGEKLIGHIVGAAGDSLTFASDLAGTVKIGWSKVKELQSSSGRFAVLQKAVDLGRHVDTAKVLQGTISESDQKLEVSPGNGSNSQMIPLADATNIVPLESFLRAVERPHLKDFWHGSASLGAALVAATQNSRSLNTAVSLVRTVPNETWIDPRYRTSLDFNSAYGELTQSGQPTVKTDIIHGDAEQDEYFSKRLFVFGSAAFDHSFSQGLKLQQTYGGGLGYTVFKTAIHELDLKAQIAYIKYAYEPTTEANGSTSANASSDIIGAVFTETYNRYFKHGLTLHEQLAIAPAFNEAKAYSALGTVNLSIPVFKKLGFTIGTVDSYLNQPPVGFKKNSFQFVTSLTYTIN